MEFQLRPSPSGSLSKATLETLATVYPPYMDCFDGGVEMRELLWTFFNSHLFLGVLSLLVGGFGAKFLSARWQRENHKHQVGIKVLSSLCSNFAAWLNALPTRKGREPASLNRALNRLTATILFAQNLLPTTEIIKWAQTLLDNAQMCTHGEGDQPEALDRAKKGFRELAISVRNEIGLAAGRPRN